MIENPVVSVLIITYNHEKYISHTIEGALDQIADFSVEIVIGEDASTDKTREICSVYAAKYSDRIRILPIDKNLGSVLNFRRTLDACRGKYIAICEGDDYWSDLSKLQKQVDFLKANLDCVVCHHWQEIAEQNESGNYEIKPAPKKGHGYYPAKKASVQKIFSNELRVKTRTLMFRNVGLEFPKWFSKLGFADVPLNMLLGKYGDFGFIDEPMAVYRLTGKGVSTAGIAHPLYFYNHYLEWIKVWELGNIHYDYLYNVEATQTIVSFYKVILSKYNNSLNVVTGLVVYCIFKSKLSLKNRLHIFNIVFIGLLIKGMHSRWKKLVN